VKSSAFSKGNWKWQAFSIGFHVVAIALFLWIAPVRDIFTVQLPDTETTKEELKRKLTGEALEKVKKKREAQLQKKLKATVARFEEIDKSLTKSEEEETAEDEPALPEEPENLTAEETLEHLQELASEVMQNVDEALLEQLAEQMQIQSDEAEDYFYSPLADALKELAESASNLSEAASKVSDGVSMEEYNQAMASAVQAAQNAAAETEAALSSGSNSPSGDGNLPIDGFADAGAESGMPGEMGSAVTSGTGSSEPSASNASESSDSSTSAAPSAAAGAEAGSTASAGTSGSGTAGQQGAMGEEAGTTAGAGAMASLSASGMGQGMASGSQAAAAGAGQSSGMSGYGSGQSDGPARYHSENSGFTEIDPAALKDGPRRVESISKASLATHKITASSNSATASGPVFLNSWYIIGPFENNRKIDFSRRLPPELNFDLDAAYRGKEGKLLRWKFYQSQRPDIYVPDIRANSTYYAYAELRSDVTTRAIVQAGADDALRIWWNGKHIYTSEDTLKSKSWGECFQPVVIRKGTNRVLLRVENLPKKCHFTFILLPWDEKYILSRQ